MRQRTALVYGWTTETQKKILIYYFAMTLLTEGLENINRSTALRQYAIMPDEVHEGSRLSK